jgi:DNA replication and repair protein RecF
VGRNAQGKTNLLEAISYLGSGKSFRAQKTGEMIRFGADFADLEGQVFAQEREQTIRWVLFNGSRPRQIWRNGGKKKAAGEIAGVLPTVLFCPEDLMILKMGSSQRRRFADHALCQLRPNYDAALTEYSRILDQKSRILKDHFDNPAVLEILPEYNARLCQVGALLISYRARFYDSLGKAAATYHNQFSGGAEDFYLEYKTVSTVTDPFAPVSELNQQLQEHLQRHYRA